MMRLIVVMLILAIAAGCGQQAEEQTPPGQNSLISLSEFSANSLPQAEDMQVVELSDDVFELKAEVVEKELFGKAQVMFAYNKQIPGPVLKVKQGDRKTVRFVNNLPYETTVHWHGLRHDNKFDGVPGVTQEAVLPGESFDYELYFPDHGAYWYHPHVREDLQQEAGLAGLIIVEPKDKDDIREEVIVLDDIATSAGSIAAFGKDEAMHALMGRFGNIIMVNGKRDFVLEAKAGETIRIYIANIANARPFNLTFDGAKLKVIGSDLSYYEKEYFADSVVIAPAERYIVEVQFEGQGEHLIRNVNSINTRLIGKVAVAEGSGKMNFEAKAHPEVTREIESIRQYFEKEADYELELLADVGPELMRQMHVGMSTMPCHKMPDGSMMGNCEEEEHRGGIEWEDNMGMINELSNTNMVKWTIKDAKSGLENMDLRMKANVGDKVKISINNNENGMHPMQHPIHLHGQRFLVLSVDGKPTENFVWKDTILVPTGAKIEILVDVTNPGKWMLHCHIAEHLEAGMMAMMEVGE